ncbi:MAG: hypothetical protein IH989_08870 [Planctomycetes bacterium]|nr:hypothetical protein [Planctomycetota bacterium]
MKRIGWLAPPRLLPLLLLASAAHAGDKPVTVTGQGLTEESACRDAMRKAIERGAGNEISSRSHVENAVLIRDVIFARADGIITEHVVLETGSAADGTKFCKIRAIVSPGAIASTWAEVQNLLAQLGRPGLMVYIRERIDGVDQDSSIAEAEIERRFLEAGFTVHARRQVDALARREIDQALENGNVNRVQELAKRFATEIFITGTSDASSAGTRVLAGQDVAMYNADSVIKMFYTDTGELLASQPLTNCRGGTRTLRGDSRQGGKKALENCAKELADACYDIVMRSWATRISAGQTLKLEVEGISFADAVKLEKKLEAIDPDKIRSVDRWFSSGVARYTITATMTASDLAEYFVRGDWPALIEITDQQTNRIRAKWVGR